MTRVSRFEADLLRILHAILGRSPFDRVLPLVVSRREPPRCLGRGALRLVEDSLAKGVVLRLARMGGWQIDRFVRGDRVASGRLWERSPADELAMEFSGESLEFLIWLTARHPGDRTHRWEAGEATLTVGDRLLLFFAFDAGTASEIAGYLGELPAIARLGPARLAFPDLFAERSELPAPDFAPWVSGPGACALEVMQPMLARRWEAVERQKAKIADPRAMVALGGEQRRVLGAFLDAVDGAGRRDLARFLLPAASAVLGTGQEASAWIGDLNMDGLRLADRAEAHRGALALLESLDRLRSWERSARTIGYFDEGYAASQLCKADWEAAGGDRLCERAAAIARALDPMGR